MVCVPKEEGGLGVINLEKQNEALLMKNLDKFFNKKDIPWVSLIWEMYYPNGKLPSHTKKGSLWWRNILKVLDCFKSFYTVQVQNGQTCLLWSDNWVQQNLKLQYPELFSFAKNKAISVCKFYSQNSTQDLFSLPLLAEDFQQLQALQSLGDHFPLRDQDDVWHLNWGYFSASKAYKFLIGHRQVPQVFKCFYSSREFPQVLRWLKLCS